MIGRKSAWPGESRGGAGASRGLRASRGRSKPRAKAGTRTEPRWVWGLLLAFIFTLFVPNEVAVNIASIKLTPALAVSILLFPVLIAWARIRWAWPDVLVLGYYLVTFLSLLLTSPLDDSVIAMGRRVLAGAVPYLVGRYLGTRPDLLKPFFKLLVTIMAALGIAVIAESFMRVNIHSILWGVPYDPHPDKRLGLTRAHGWTSHAIMLGLSYAVFVPVMIIVAVERLKGFGRFAWLKVALLCVGVFCSLSTGAWLPVVIAVALIVWDYGSLLKPAQRWLAVGLGGPMMYFILEIASGRPLLRILMMELHLTSPLAWYYRWKLYERVFEVMPGQWLFGWGLITPPQFANTVQWSIDNNFLMVLMSYGLVGLAVWILIPLGVIFYAWPSVWRAPDLPYVRLARAVMFSIVAVLLTQLSVALFSTAAMLYWLFLGVGLGMAQGLKPVVAKARKTRQAKRRRPPRGLPRRPPRPAPGTATPLSFRVD